MSPIKDPPTISAEDARGGEVIPRTRTRRMIFVAGLIGFVLAALLVAMFR